MENRDRWKKGSIIEQGEVDAGGVGGDGEYGRSAGDERREEEMGHVRAPVLARYVPFNGLLFYFYASPPRFTIFPRSTLSCATKGLVLSDLSKMGEGSMPVWRTKVRSSST